MVFIRKKKKESNGFLFSADVGGLGGRDCFQLSYSLFNEIVVVVDVVYYIRLFILLKILIPI
jgi:hypothetical protein